MNARIMGAKFDDDKFGNPPSGNDEVKIKPDETPMMFGEPEAFKHLTDDQRREMTQRMKMRHKAMSQLSAINKK